MDQELAQKIKTKIISMNDYLESHPRISYCARKEAKP